MGLFWPLLVEITEVLDELSVYDNEVTGDAADFELGNTGRGTPTLGLSKLDVSLCLGVLKVLVLLVLFDGLDGKVNGLSGAVDLELREIGVGVVVDVVCVPLVVRTVVVLVNNRLGVVG